MTYRDRNWCNLPGWQNPRWILPNAPRKTAQSAISLYQPMTWSAIVGWKAARMAAAVGAFRLLPPGRPPPEQVANALQPHVKPEWTMAVSRTKHRGRYIVLIIGSDGECHSFAKVETLESEYPRLRQEVQALKEIAPLLPPPLSAPRVLAIGSGVLLLQTVPWHPRPRPWRLTEDVASAMGSFYAAKAGLQPSHGDFAPWNLLRTSEGWVVVDWETAATHTQPFFDVLHYVVQAHALLGRPSARVLLQGLEGSGWVGMALRAYAHAAEVDAADARPALRAYLEWSNAEQDQGDPDGRRGLKARQKLLDEVAG